MEKVECEMNPFDQLCQKYKSLRKNEAARAEFREWCKVQKFDIETSTFADLDMYYGDFLSAYFPEEK